MGVAGTNTVGEEMEAKILSINPGGHSGSSPQESSKLYNAVKIRRGTYVRGHLLNHHLHGAGIAENLVPITDDFNKEMERNFESPVKRLVLNDRKVVKYKVTAVWRDRANHIGHPERTSIEAEKHLPSEFACEMNVLKPKAGARGDALQNPEGWENDPDGESISQSLPHNLPADVPPSPTGEAQAQHVLRLSINNPGVPRERAIAAYKDALRGVGPALAERLYDNKPYEEWYHIVDDVSGISERMVDDWEIQGNIFLDGDTQWG